MKGFLIGLIVAAVGGIGVTAFALDNDDKIVENLVKQDAVSGASIKGCDDDCRGDYHKDDCENNPVYIELRDKIENDLVGEYGDNWHETLRAQYGSEWDDVIEDKYEKVYGDIADDIIDSKLGYNDCDDDYDHDNCSKGNHCLDDDCLDDLD